MSTSESVNLTIDYLQLYLDHKSHPLFGDSVSTFGDNAPTGSLYAVLWSDAVSHTSRGTFELTATCHSWQLNKERDIWILI